MLIKIHVYSFSKFMKYLLILDSIERSGIFLFMLNICYNTVQNQLLVYVHAFSWNKRTRLRPKVKIDDMHSLIYVLYQCILIKYVFTHILNYYYQHFQWFLNYQLISDNWVAVLYLCKGCSEEFAASRATKLRWKSSIFI